jgi:hypothetical protein
MEKVWEDEDNPQALFFRELLNRRVDKLVSSPTWLRSLRYRYDEVCWWLKNAGYIFEERGLNLYELIAQAHNECWDEKKSVPSLVKEKPRQNAVRVDYSRETSVREKQEKEPELQVRPSHERC